MSTDPAWDDEPPTDKHDTRCSIWTSDDACTCGADNDHLQWPLLAGDRGSTAHRLDALALPCEEAS